MKLRIFILLFISMSLFCGNSGSDEPDEPDEPVEFAIESFTVAETDIMGNTGTGYLTWTINFTQNLNVDDNIHLNYAEGPDNMNLHTSYNYMCADMSLRYDFGSGAFSTTFTSSGGSPMNIDAATNRIRVRCSLLGSSRAGDNSNANAARLTIVSIERARITMEMDRSVSITRGDTSTSL